MKRHSFAASMPSMPSMLSLDDVLARLPKQPNVLSQNHATIEPNSYEQHAYKQHAYEEPEPKLEPEFKQKIPMPTQTKTPFYVRTLLFQLLTQMDPMSKMYTMDMSMDAMEHLRSQCVDFLSQAKVQSLTTRKRARDAIYFLEQRVGPHQLPKYSKDLIVEKLPSLAWVLSFLLSCVIDYEGKHIMYSKELKESFKNKNNKTSNANDATIKIVRLRFEFENNQWGLETLETF
jgi:hypothetical protein